MSDSINQQEVNLRRQIQECAGLAYDVNRSANLLFTVNQLIAQRAMLAELISRGKLNDERAGVEQFKYINEQIKRALNL